MRIMHAYPKLDQGWQTKSLPSLAQDQLSSMHSSSLPSQPSDLISHLSARRSMLDANPELKERRKALSKAAFVRHDTADMMDSIRRAAVALKNMDKNRRLRKGNSTSLVPDELTALLKPSVPHHGIQVHIPGTIYGDAATTTQSTVSLPPIASSSLPSQEDSMQTRLPAAAIAAGGRGLDGSGVQHEAQLQMARAVLGAMSVPATPIALRQYDSDFSPDVPGTMNGIGHPLLDSSLLLDGAIHPKFVFRHKHPGGEATRAAPQGTALTVGNIQLPAVYRHSQDVSLPLASNKTLLDDAGLSRAKPSPSATMQLLPMPTSSPVVETKVHVNKPLSDDTLNLWRGKRLNLTEMKIESQLHRLRNNPTAKGELQTRVSRFLSEKAEEAAEIAALQLFASETREQKALTFLQRQMQYAPRSAERAVSATPVTNKRPTALTGVAALFDPQTGEPIEDDHPLPATSVSTWHGFVALSKVLHALKQCLDASRWAHEELGVQVKAATKIQATWKGHRARKLAKSIRARRDHLAQTSRKMRLGHTEQSAAQLILQFLQDYDLAGRKGAAAAMMKQAVAGVGQDKARAALVRNMRLAILIRQWSAVEAAAIEVAKKRLRGNAALGVVVAPPRKQTLTGVAGGATSRKKGGQQIAYGEDRQQMLKAAIEDALAHTVINDKIIQEDLTPVPEVVKAAILNAYLEHKMAAYTALVGVVWKERVRWRVAKRHVDAKVAAKGLMNEQPDEAGGQPAAESDLAIAGSMTGAPSGCLDTHEGVDHESITDMCGREASFTNVDHQNAIDERKGGTQDGTQHSRGRAFSVPSRRHQSKQQRECPVVPHFRVLATPMEMKALMQQGVHEMPSFNSFKIREAMGTAYDRKVTDSLLNRSQPTSSTSGKSTGKQAKSGGKQAGNQADESESVSSFTVALLLHRWKSDCTPRSHACLRKRYGLLKVDLVDCLSTTKVWSAEDIGQHLQNLVAAT